MPAKYPLTGGLDLTTVKPLAKPGTLKECLNFEVSTLSGYSRISGLARFDGSTDVGSAKIWRLKYVGGQLLSPGDQVWFDPTKACYVLDVTEQDGNAVAYVLVPGEHPNPQLPATLTAPNIDGGINIEIINREAVFSGHGTQDVYDAALSQIEQTQISGISLVPGRVESDIIGGFWFKDRLYVIRDLPRIAFQGGYYTDAMEGQCITVDGVSYKILDVAITGDNAGLLTYDTVVANAGVQAAPIGAAELVNLPVTGDYGDGYTFVPYSDDLNVSGGVAPYTWSLSGEEGIALEPIESPDASAINFLPQLTNAALYRSSANGWERVDLGRELAFRNGTSNIVNFLRSAVLTGSTVLDTGFIYPSAGTVNGATTTALGADDGTEAALQTGQFTTFQATGFDFSIVPDNAAIQGVEVIIERHSNTGNPAHDLVVNLMGVEGGTSNKAKAGVWPNATTTVTYGGPADLWDSQHITGEIIKSSDFGVRVIASSNGNVDAVGGMDRIQVKVYYIERDSQIYVTDGTIDVQFTLHHSQIVSGDPAGSTAQGYMSVTGDVNALKPRQVTEGDEIRTGPNGTGILLGLVAARDRPVFLAGQAEIDNNRSRYQFTQHNFYGQDEFDAIYGVCGASPAFGFDGTRFIRIRTELPAHQDLPRHIVAWGDMLALGYFPGAIAFSKPGDPFEMRGSAGANAVEVGDRLTGLIPLAGDALGIICQSQTQVIRGTTPETAVKSPISAKRGGIEYTAVDMGRIVLCDGLGIFLADSPESFGAAVRNYISQPVHPWLSPRLQATLNTEASFLRPVAALNVRSKNQMRLYFWDGWQLTATMNEPPEFTTQRYYTPAADANTEPVPWVPRMLCSGIDSSGRERLFCSFFGGVKSGLVFEMDVSRSLDGANIPAYIVLNPLTLEASSKEKRYDRFFLYGSGLGRASLTHTRSINDGDSFSGTFSFKIGRGDRLAKTTWAGMRGIVDSPAEAFDISLRFDSNSATDGVFSLQYVEFNASDRGDSRGRQGDHK